MKIFKRKNAVWLILLLLALIAVVAGLLVSSEEEHQFWWSDLHVFFAFMGFLGCLAIIFVAKSLSHYLLQRKEDYYD